MGYKVLGLHLIVDQDLGLHLCMLVLVRWKADLVLLKVVIPRRRSIRVLAKVSSEACSMLYTNELEYGFTAVFPVMVTHAIVC